MISVFDSRMKFQCRPMYRVQVGFSCDTNLGIGPGILVTLHNQSVRSLDLYGCCICPDDLSHVPYKQLERQDGRQTQNLNIEILTIR
jgi:hypothetical protein